MIVEDDRTPEQRKSHTVMVVMTDSFLSGWGRAEGGPSVAAWAVGPDDTVENAERWVRSRGDAKRVRVVYDSPRRYRPRRAAHFHVYVWTPR